MTLPLTQEEFLRRAHAQHGMRYDYSNTHFTTTSTPLTVTCREHGPFSTWPRSHTHGSNGGCPKCRSILLAEAYKTTADSFLRDAKELHLEAYDYSQTLFIDRKTPVTIICMKHGPFKQTPQFHLLKKRGGCLECALVKRKGSTEDFVNQASVVHNGQYSYEKTTFRLRQDAVIVTCAQHGDFMIRAAKHLQGHGCQACSRGTSIKSKTRTLEEFIAQASQVHGNKFSYRKSVYTIALNKIEIECPEHGAFWQVANDHLRGVGCRFCKGGPSKPHQKVIDFIQSLGYSQPADFYVNDRKTLRNPSTGRFLELDIYLPALGIAIEIDGNFFHGKNPDSYKRVDVAFTEKQDALKNALALQQGILLQRFSDIEINRSWTIVKERIAHLLSTAPHPSL